MIPPPSKATDARESVALSRRLREDHAERFLSAIMESAPEGILVTGAGTEVKECNQRFLEVWGVTDLTPAQMEGVALFQFLSMRVQNPEELFASLSSPEEREHRALLQLMDGRYLELFSKVQKPGGDCAWRVWRFCDVTARYRDQLAALHLAAIVESSDDAIISKDLNGIIKTWNRGAQRIFGYTPEEIVGTSIMRLIPADRQNEEQHILAKIRNGEQVNHFETLRQTKDNQLIHISVIASPIRNAEGKVVGVSKVARDITESRRAAEALQASEASLIAAQARARLGSWELDLQSGDGIWSAEMSRLHWRNAETGAPTLEEFMRMVHPEDRVGLEQIHARIPAMSEPLTHEYRTHPDQGPVRFLRSTMELIRDAAGRPSRLAGTALDLSEQKLTEQALHETEQKFQIMLNAIPQLAWIAYADGSIFWYNQRWFEFTGTTFEQMEGWGWQRVHDPELLPDVIARWTGAIANAQAFDMEFPLRGADGKFRWFLTRAVPMKDNQGRVFRWLGTNTDISDRRDSEAEIQTLNTTLEQRVSERTAQLEAANKELEAFSYSVSHDLRAPLRAVDGFSQAVLEDFGELLPAEGQRYLQLLREAAQRMGALIDDLLAFSRLSRTQIARRPVDVNVQVRALVAEACAQNGEHPPEIRVEELPSCWADLALLRQVWVNLISNAIKYSSKRSQPLIKIGAQLEGGSVIYFVRDNGTGFDMRYAGKLFGVFQRLHRQEEYEGTGVGLAIVQRIVHRHGGRIWAESAVDRGATFFFTIPGKAHT